MVPPIAVFMDMTFNELGKSGDGFLGVGTARFELDQRAELGTQRHQVQDALCIGLPAVPENTNFGLELLCAAAPIG